MQRLEKRTRVQKDLSGFRILLGESSNLGNLLDLIEKGTVRDGTLYIPMQNIQDSDFTVEMMSLVDIGLAVCQKGNNGEELKLDDMFCSWLLEYISNTSDRISFGDLFST